MIRSLLTWLTARLREPRVIFNRMGTGPYLSRWYLKGRPYMEDGSSPFDGTGGTKPEAIYPPGIGLYLHRFHESDDEEFHNHPFEWAVSLVLCGGYYEDRLGDRNEPKRRRVRTWTLNVLRPKDFHRVDLIEKDAWSLFIAGPKIQSWGFWSPKLKIYVPWRPFIENKRAGVYRHDRE